MPDDAARRHFRFGPVRRPAPPQRKDIRAAASHMNAERKTARIQEAVAIAMLSDSAHWNLRLTETLTPHATHMSRKVRHEVRIPSASDLAHSVLAGRHLPTPSEKSRLIIPVAFRPRGKLLTGFVITSSHLPVTVLNYDDGEAFIRRVLSRLLESPIRRLNDTSWWLARVLRNNYVQMVEIEARLGETVNIEYSMKLRHFEASLNKFAALRLSVGWRQNRFRFDSDLHDRASSYHFHFEAPDGYMLKAMEIKPVVGGENIQPYVFSGAGTPDGHLYAQRMGQDNLIELDTLHSRYIFIDCFEAPPGSQGYTAILGCVTTCILLFLIVALSHGWLIDPTTNKTQATGAIALIAGSPAVLASIIPLRHESSSAIKSPLTARLALWSSTAMSAFVALALATQGFGNELSALKGVNLFACFLHGFATTCGIVLSLLIVRYAVRKKLRKVGFLSLFALLAIGYLVLTQPGRVSTVDFFFSAIVPIYVLTWFRCVVGWAKSVYVASNIGEIALHSNNKHDRLVVDYAKPRTHHEASSGGA